VFNLRRLAYFLVALSLTFSQIIYAQVNSDVNLRDPTVPISFNKINNGKVSESLVLSSIFFSTHKKVAIINGKSVVEGKVIPNSGGALVKSIHNDYVIVQKINKQWKINISPLFIKRN
jgi:hypothetical protein